MVGIDPHLDAEHQLVALAFGLDRLRRELRLRRDEGDMRGNGAFRIGVEHDFGVRSDFGAAGVGGWQIDVHIDVRNIEQGEHFAAGRQNFADIGDTVLDATDGRRDQRIVRDIDLVKLDVVARGVERILGLSDAGVGGVQKRERAIEGLPSLVEQLVRRVAARDEGRRAIDLLLRQRRLRLLLYDIGVRLLQAALGLLNLRLGLFERGFEVAHVHARDDLPSADEIALIDQQFRDAPGEFRVDVDFLRLDAAIARHDAVRQLRQMLAPPIETADAGAGANQGHDEKHLPARLPARRRDRLRRGRKSLRRGHESARGRRRGRWRIIRRCRALRIGGICRFRRHARSNRGNRPHRTLRL